MGNETASHTVVKGFCIQSVAVWVRGCLICEVTTVESASLLQTLVHRFFLGKHTRACHKLLEGKCKCHLLRERTVAGIVAVL